MGLAGAVLFRRSQAKSGGIQWYKTAVAVGAGQADPYPPPPPQVGLKVRSADDKATHEQIAAAERLLYGSKRQNESQIRQNLSRLLDSLEIDNIVEYATPNGPCDLILPRHRTIIETKRIGLADDPEKPQSKHGSESAREQMERYMFGQIKNDLGLTSPDDNDYQNCEWTGIVTDGVLWHAWRYEHNEMPTSKQILNSKQPYNANNLIATISGLVGEEVIGKPWVPKDLPKRLSDYYFDGLYSIYIGLRDRNATEAKTKLVLWLDMLKTSGMAPSRTDEELGLFVKHCLLVTVARGVIHTLTHPSVSPNANKILREGFVSWIIKTEKGLRWATSVLKELHQYEWRKPYGDLLRPVYEALIAQRERKDFGEVYTPDWLAAMIVEEVLDDDWCERASDAALGSSGSGELTGVGVLDPACGSGTFLYHACKKIMRASSLQSSELPKAQKAGAIARLVNGIDVHPVAAEVARATILRALPAEPPDGSSAIQVVQGDSLLAHREHGKILFRHSEDTLMMISPSSREVHIPKSFAKGASLVRNMKLLVEMAANHVSLPEYLLNYVPENDREMLKDARNQLQVVIDNEGNSVWAWYLVNIAGPVLLSERKIDRIVANPPWVRMAQIQVNERRRDLEDFATKQELWVGGTQAPHFDIAQLFIKRCRNLYMNDVKKDKAGWLVKRSAMTGGNWSKLQEWHRNERILEQTLNLEEIKPFGGGDAQKCCVLFEHHRCTEIMKNNHKTVRVSCKGSPPASYLGWEAVKEMLEFNREPERAPRIPSAYVNSSDKALFRQGATITPKVLVVLSKVVNIQGQLARVRTAASMHPPWNKVGELTGNIPTNWVQDVQTSDDIFPFGVSDNTRKAIIPLKESGELDFAPEERSEFWKILNEIYRENCAVGRKTPKRLIDQINFNRKLEKQLPMEDTSQKRIVAHVAAGDIMRAARLTNPSVIDASLHRWLADSEDEAAYLVGLLNAPTLNKTYVDARNSGRHFVNHVWTRVPIPKYDDTNESHRKMAKTTEIAEKIVEKHISNKNNAMSKGQVSMSRTIRKLLDKEGISAKLNSTASEILPDYVENSNG